MGNAVIRTVTDPETGETIDLMGFQNHGQLRFQRKPAVPHSARAEENRARFGETAARAWGRKKTGRLPPAAELTAREHQGPGPDPSRDQSTIRQAYYRSLLGPMMPDVQRELILRQSVMLPLAGGAPETRSAILYDRERLLRDRIATARAPLLR